MSNVQSAMSCPSCRTEGQIKKTEIVFIELFCPECELIWWTLRKEVVAG